MKKVVKKEWPELSLVWNELINKNISATPFQSYEFLTYTGKGKPYRKGLFRIWGLKEFNLVLYSNNLPIAIAPLLIKNHGKKLIVYFRGHFTNANHLDFIYSDWCYKDFKYLMDSIRGLLGNVSFFLDRVSGTSSTSDYLKEYLSSARIEENECYAIPIPQYYDDWFKNLHKSVRHHIRTSDNRIEKDQVSCSTCFFVGEIIDTDIYKKMMLVYADRFLVKNNFNFGPLRNFIKKIMQIILLKDKLTQWFKNADNSFHAVVFMNNEIAAFTSGLIFKDKRILLSRLAIYTKYSRYSPGAILIYSTISYLINQNEAGNLDIDKLDLSQGGTEGMSYKRAYGGKIYYKYNFIE